MTNNYAKNDLVGYGDKIWFKPSKANRISLWPFNFHLFSSMTNQEWVG